MGVFAPLALALLALPHGSQLPASGDGYFTPAAWRDRGLRWGTQELVALIERAARRVKNERPGATLYVADLSQKGGGRTPWHRSHRYGRDVDLIYYATDEEGATAPIPGRMVSFDGQGFANTEDEVGRPVRIALDTARNWTLVKALLEDSQVEVTHIFMAEPIKRRLLAYARTAGEEEPLLARADRVLEQPGDSTAHDDHMHVRIAGGPQPKHTSARNARKTRPRPRKRH
jgi:penicillin-insensitive murein endopeptidase